MKINKLLFPLLFSIVFLQPSVSYSSVPDFIEKDTLDNICKYSECTDELKNKYNPYRVKQFHKAFAVSYEINKITNKYKIISFGLSYGDSQTIAKNEAIKNCKRKIFYCEGNEEHSEWPNRNKLIMDFLLNY